MIRILFIHAFRLSNKITKILGQWIRNWRYNQYVYSTMGRLVRKMLLVLFFFPFLPLAILITNIICPCFLIHRLEILIVATLYVLWKSNERMQVSNSCQLFFLITDLTINQYKWLGKSGTHGNHGYSRRHLAKKLIKSLACFYFHVTFMPLAQPAEIICSLAHWTCKVKGHRKEIGHYLFAKLLCYLNLKSFFWGR